MPGLTPTEQRILDTLHPTTPRSARLVRDLLDPPMSLESVRIAIGALAVAGFAMPVPSRPRTPLTFIRVESGPL